MRILNKIIIKVLRIVIILLLLTSCNIYSNRPINFDKIIWNSWDIMYDERRYNMALWFFKENWFNGKTKDIILNELSYKERINHIKHFYNGIIEENNILLYDLKYSNEFMERYNIDFDFKPIAYLKIYFNENNEVIKVELYEGKRRMNVNNYKLKKYWELK